MGKEIKIVFTTRLPESGFARLTEAKYRLVIPNSGYFSREELLSEITDADVLVSTFDYAVPADVLAHAAQLRLVANFGVGFNNIDIDYCQTHRIAVTNTPHTVTEPTAEHCFALMHTIAHRTAELDRQLRMPHSPIIFGVMNNLGVSLYGKQLGIIGMGRIGQALARRAIACGMSIAYHNRHCLPEDIERRFSARFMTMDELLATSDFVSLNLPYTSAVHHLINREALSKMKRTAILINTARGAHIDEAALVEALRKGTIAGAALDVFEHEPKITPELLNMDNVVLSPHVGTGTIDGRLDMCRNVEDNILAFTAGKTNEMNLVTII